MQNMSLNVGSVLLLVLVLLITFLLKTSWVAGDPNLWDLMPNDLLLLLLCNYNGNKVHSKCNALESCLNHPPPQFVEKLPSVKPVPGAKRVRNR